MCACASGQTLLSSTISGSFSHPCPLSQWCSLTISYSSPPFSFVFKLSQYQRLFQWIGSSHRVAKVLEFQLEHQSFQWIVRVDFLQSWLIWSPCSPRDSNESFPAPQFKSINSLALSLLCFPCGSSGKESACNAGDLGCIAGLGRSPGEGKSYPRQYYGLENSMDYIVHEVAKSRT